MSVDERARVSAPLSEDTDPRSAFSILDVEPDDLDTETLHAVARAGHLGRALAVPDPVPEDRIVQIGSDYEPGDARLHAYHTTKCNGLAAGENEHPRSALGDDVTECEQCKFNRTAHTDDVAADSVFREAVGLLIKGGAKTAATMHLPEDPDAEYLESRCEANFGNEPTQKDPKIYPPTYPSYCGRCVGWWLAEQLAPQLRS